MAGYLNLPTDAERNYQKRIVDSKGQAGPTLQRIADRAKVYKNNTGMLEAMFEAISPMAMYSGEAEGAHIPSKAMQNAQGLAKVFQDWYKTGTPTINVPFDKWSDIIKSGKFKNQMELAGKNHPEAWKQRIEVEKQLGGFPYPMEMIKPANDKLLDYLKVRMEYLKNNQTNAENIQDLELIKQQLHELETRRLKPEYSESLAKQNPIYGHIYNPKYTHEGTATKFGNTHAEMSDLVKDQSRYVLGDSFHPFVKTAFSSDDMLGNTSRLERALFDKNRSDWEHDKIRRDPQGIAQYMEMWVPNHLARLNNVKGVHVPSNAYLISSPNGSFRKGISKAVPAKEVPKLETWTDLDIMQREMDNLSYKQRIEEELAKAKSGEFKPFSFPKDDEIPF